MLRRLVARGEALYCCCRLKLLTSLKITVPLPETEEAAVRAVPMVLVMPFMVGSVEVVEVLAPAPGTGTCPTTTATVPAAAH